MGSKKETDPLLVEAELVEDVLHDEEAGEPATVVEFPFVTRLHQVLTASFQLGLTAFGDTTLKIALIEDAVVEKGKWVGYETFMELFGLAQAVPGPVATQVLMSAAMAHAGPLGALVSLIFWALPGATLLTIIGVLVKDVIDTDRLDVWLAGVAPATVALVLYASVNFARNLDRFSFGLALTSCFCSVLIDGDKNIHNRTTACAYPVMLVSGGVLAVVDCLFLKIGDYQVSGVNVQRITNQINMPIWGGLMILQLWLIILLTGILLYSLVYPDDPRVYVFSKFFRIGSVVFGGEEAVLPMISSEMVPDWITDINFTHGLALAQAVPGSIFNLAAYIGAIHSGNIGTALVAVISIYLPSYLFLIAIIPIWIKLRQVPFFKALLKGVNAVAVGFMGAMCIFLWEGNIEIGSDAMILVVCLGLVSYYQVSAPIIIVIAIVLGLILNEEGINVAQKSYNSGEF